MAIHGRWQLQEAVFWCEIQELILCWCGSKGWLLCRTCKNVTNGPCTFKCLFSHFFFLFFPARGCRIGLACVKALVFAFLSTSTTWIPPTHVIKYALQLRNKFRKAWSESSGNKQRWLFSKGRPKAWDDSAATFWQQAFFMFRFMLAGEQMGRCSALCCTVLRISRGERWNFWDWKGGVLVPWHFITCLRRSKTQACWYFKGPWAVWNHWLHLVNVL